MGDVQEFVKSLKEEGFKTIAIDVEGEISLVNIEGLLIEVEKIGIQEVCDTYYEELGFIANDGKFIQIYAVC